MRPWLTALVILIALIAIALNAWMTSATPVNQTRVRPQTEGLIGCFGGAYDFVGGQTRCVEVGFVYSDGHVVYHHLRSQGERQ